MYLLILSWQVQIEKKIKLESNRTQIQMYLADVSEYLTLLYLHARSNQQIEFALIAKLN